MIVFGLIVCVLLICSAVVWSRLKAEIDHICDFELIGIMRDGSLIESCGSCTRVHIYKVSLDGEAENLIEIHRRRGELAGDAILRVYKEQNDETGGVD